MTHLRFNCPSRRIWIPLSLSASPLSSDPLHWTLSASATPPTLLLLAHAFHLHFPIWLIASISCFRAQFWSWGSIFDLGFRVNPLVGEWSYWHGRWPGRFFVLDLFRGKKEKEGTKKEDAARSAEEGCFFIHVAPFVCRVCYGVVRWYGTQWCYKNRKLETGVTENGK